METAKKHAESLQKLGLSKEEGKTFGKTSYWVLPGRAVRALVNECPARPPSKKRLAVEMDQDMPELEDVSDGELVLEEEYEILDEAELMEEEREVEVVGAVEREEPVPKAPLEVPGVMEMAKAMADLTEAIKENTKETKKLRYELEDARKGKK